MEKENKLDEKKICFIICSNNEIYLNECMHYLQHLLVPDGYDIDVAVIEDAKSITMGYNEGMHSSNAKYKVYMHQDVFILNKYFLSDVLDIFAGDPQIGMIGQVGYKRISEDGIMWHEKRYGAMYRQQDATSYADLQEYRYSLAEDRYSNVALIDGFMMVTAYDLPWAEEFLDGWDFYDVFQSISFLEHGYKIVVPMQRHPWCLHDSGLILNMSNYDRYRRIFMDKYADYL